MHIFATFAPLTAIVSTISRSAGAILFTAVWQSAVIAGSLALFMKLVPRANAGHRFLIWSAGFSAAVALPFLPLLTQLSSQPANSAPAHLPMTAAEPLLRPLLQLDIRWSIAVAALWALASLYRASDLLLHSLRLRNLWRSARVQAVQGELASRLALSVPWRQAAELCTTAELERPSVLGFLAPRILIPEWLFTKLTPGELDQIVLHETEHLRRGDDWTNLLQKLALVLFPLNPALVWMERRLCQEREMACDEGVVRVTQEPRAYAACLTSLAERGLEHHARPVPVGALSLGAWQHRPELVRRVHRILWRKRALGPLGATALLAVTGFGLTVGSAELARCPQLIDFTAPPATEMAQTAAPDLTKPFDASGYAPVKAIMPSRPAISLTNPTAAKPSALRRSAVTTPPAPEASIVSEQQALSAQPVLANSSHPSLDQSWIVLTSWEETEAPAPPNGDQAAEGPAPLPKKQMTVTRLIFRVLPANSDSRLPTLVPTRGGWLVIQL
jgi:beta-lactamase regulating signal transducer with metallopeptidase domain